MKSSSRIRLATRLRKIRHSLGKSQVDMANDLDMGRSYYAEVESGKRNISLDALSKIANGLGFTLSKLFEGV